MKRMTLWLSSLFLLAAFAFGPASAGSVKYTPAADDNYVAMCDDAGQVADAGLMLAQARTDQKIEMKTIVPKSPSATNTMKATGQSVQKIDKGGCCAKVHNGCVSWCNKTGGCTGSGDCDTFKAN